jgi:hypothetical protein
MSYIIYAGIKYNQIRHAIYCKKCTDTIESLFQHDFKYCSCGAVGIDGGILNGNTYIGNIGDMEPRSMYVTIIDKRQIWLPQNIIEQYFYSSK